MGNNHGRISGLKDLRIRKKTLKEELAPIKQWVTVCGGTGCQAYGCTKVSEAIKEEILARGLDTYIKVRVTGCHGFCERGPLAVFSPSGIFYQKIKPKDAKAIVEETLINQQVIDRLLYEDPISKEKITSEKEVPFYKNQKRLIFGMNGLIDPTRIESYIANEGYEALGKALLESSPENIISDIKEAGLRGRGERGSRRESNGSSAGIFPEKRSILSATAMRVIPAPTWTAAFWKAIPIRSLRG